MVEEKSWLTNYIIDRIVRIAYNDTFKNCFDLIIIYATFGMILPLRVLIVCTVNPSSGLLWALRGRGIVSGSATVMEELIYFCGHITGKIPPPPRPHDIQLIPINGQI